jgi:dolichol-phosphate mannosyltransferase
MPNYPKRGFDLFLMDSKYLSVITDSSKSSSVPLILTWIGIEPYVIKYNRLARNHGKSKWSFIKRINLLLDVLFSFSPKPIRLVSAIGAMTALVGLFFGLTVIYEKLSGSTVSQGTASLIALVSFSSGLILLTLGIIAEYIWRIWDEVNKRPNGIEK